MLTLFRDVDQTTRPYARPHESNAPNHVLLGFQTTHMKMNFSILVLYRIVSRKYGKRTSEGREGVCTCTRLRCSFQALHGFQVVRGGERALRELLCIEMWYLHPDNIMERKREKILS